MTRHTILETPLGSLLALGDGDCLTGLYMHGRPHAPPREHWGRHDPGCFDLLSRQLRTYFAGELLRFDLPVRLSGTELQQRVWRELERIPYGETRSYLDVARAVGRPRAARAVGAANGRNPVSIVVPCHRVVGSNGSLTGYASGVDRKRWLLEHESDHRGRGPAAPTRGPSRRAQIVQRDPSNFVKVKPENSSL